MKYLNIRIKIDKEMSKKLNESKSVFNDIPRHIHKAIKDYDKLPKESALLTGFGGGVKRSS